MKAQGYESDLKSHARPLLELDGGDRECSCTCIKTTLKSGQARRGLDGAQRGIVKNFHGHGDSRVTGKKRPPVLAVRVGNGKG